MKATYARTLVWIALPAAVVIACSDDDPATPASITDAGTDAPISNVPDAQPNDSATVDAAPDASKPKCLTPATPGTCAAPSETNLPVCTLSVTGCMSATDITKFNDNAVPYELQSPLWSDNAAKTRAFVLPAGGKIHVKDCRDTASAEEKAKCVAPNGIPNGPADTGRWVFPVGTVMIKNFLFDGKIVETRLFMRVDAKTAELIANGTDWVGYNYAWNEEQTEAKLVPNDRTTVSFDTKKRKVTWVYPNFIDCIGCHNPAVGTIGPEMAQMNRTVNGKNQIDEFAAKGLFDVAPSKPYPAALPEPYANADLGLIGPGTATTEEAARSYLHTNCGFCHRPDVNDQGFDLRAGLTFKDSKLCGHKQQNGIPGQPEDLLDFKPADHANSAMWRRMNIPMSSEDPNSGVDVGRMPPVSSFVVDPQATDLVGKWIDSVATCP